MKYRIDFEITKPVDENDDRFCIETNKFGRVMDKFGLEYKSCCCLQNSLVIYRIATKGKPLPEEVRKYSKVKSVREWTREDDDEVFPRTTAADIDKSI